MTTSLLTAAEMAKALRVSSKTIHRWVRAGRLGPVIRLPGGSIRIPGKTLGRFVTAKQPA